MTKQLIFQFSSSREWASAIIRDVCGSPFSHCDLVMEDGQSLYGASNNPKAPYIEGNPDGVAIRPHDYQPFHIRRRAIVEVAEYEYALFMQLARNELGKKFDNDAVTLKWFFNDQPFRRDFRYDEHWFCIELMVYLLEKISFWPYPAIIAKCRWSPDRLLDWLWPYMINRPTFWAPPEGVELMKGEIVYLENMDPPRLAALFGSGMAKQP